MTAYSNQIKEYISRFKDEVRSDGLIDPQELAAWAYNKGLHKPNLSTVIDLIAADIAQVFREEYRTDKFGRSYRAKHAVKTKVGNRSQSLWGDMDDENAPREHFIKSFADRRRQIVGDCVQLKTDVDVYNDKKPEMPQIQIPLDFTNDVVELQLLNQPRKAA